MRGPTEWILRYIIKPFFFPFPLGGRLQFKSAICRNNSIRISALNFPDPRTTERVTFSFDCSQLHLEDIAKVKKDRDEELEAERSTISKLKMMGRDLIANHEHQVAQLEGETLPLTL